jgi:excinuclease ABC subunit C
VAHNRPKPAVEAVTDRDSDKPLKGVDVVRAQLRTMPNTPGVYRMIDRHGDVLYVGKAKNLKKRVTSYTKPAGMGNRIARMVAATRRMEIITTHTEAEALLLESNLIKKLKPRYNILLRDDKSFPYILITGDHDWPRITKHRGARSGKGEYFGPFASAAAVNETLNTLQRAFPLRSCSDNDFERRTRPCLQYQIKRCTAPCVGRISADDYATIVDQAREFLSGRSSEIQKQFSEKMEQASADLEFETAAMYRDRIRALTKVQTRQDINVLDVGEADVIAAHVEGGQSCIQIFFFRAGQNYGNRSYFPANTADAKAGDVLSAFIGQFYARRPPPKQVLISHTVERQDMIAEALAIRAEHKVHLTRPQRGAKRKLVEHALTNAKAALGRRLAEHGTQRRLLEGVAKLFDLDDPPERIEVYDNSHIQGSEAIGSMIVAGPEGLMKNAYRKFNIREADTVPGDDYAMMREVLTRRFKRLIKEDPDRGRGAWPDLVLIDGGKGQLSTVQEVFTELGVTDVVLAAIAKGPERNAGRETFFVPGRQPFTLEPRDPVLYFLQRLRDEAHRFAIGTHRARRSKAIGRSTLDEVAGIGAKRKRALLNHFGSAREVERAGLADLEAVDGISKTVAKTIYDHFHETN